jgi:hypothetical protein
MVPYPQAIYIMTSDRVKHTCRHQMQHAPSSLNSPALAPSPYLIALYTFPAALG